MSSYEEDLAAFMGGGAKTAPSAGGGKSYDEMLSEFTGTGKKAKKPKEKNLFEQADEALSADKGVIGQAYHVGKDVVKTAWEAPGEVARKPLESVGAGATGYVAGAADVADATANVYKHVMKSIPALKNIPPLAMGEQWLRDINQVVGRPADAPAAMGPAIREQPGYKQFQKKLPNVTHGGEILGMIGANPLKNPLVSAATKPGLAAVHAPSALIEKVLPNRLGRAAGGAATGLGFGVAGGVSQQMQAGQPVDPLAAAQQSQGLALLGAVGGALRGGKKKLQPPQKPAPEAEKGTGVTVIDPESGEVVDQSPPMIPERKPVAMLTDRESEPVDVEVVGSGERTLKGSSERGPRRIEQKIIGPSVKEKFQEGIDRAVEERRLRHPDAEGEAQATPEYLLDRIRKADDADVLRQITQDKDAPEEWQRAAYERWFELEEKGSKPVDEIDKSGEPVENTRLESTRLKEPRQMTLDEEAERIKREDQQYPLSKERFPSGEAIKLKSKKGNYSLPSEGWSPRQMTDEELARQKDQADIELERKSLNQSKRRDWRKVQKALNEEKMRREQRRVEGLSEDWPGGNRGKPLETQNPQPQAVEGSVQPTESFETEPAGLTVGDAEASGTSGKNNLLDKIRQYHEDYTTSARIAKVLKRDHPELVSQFTHRDLEQYVRENRKPEVTDYLESVKGYRNPNIKRVTPPEGVKEVPGNLGHLSDGYEYFPKEVNGDRQVWRAKTGDAGANAQFAGTFKEMRNAHPELFDKKARDAGKQDKLADSIAEGLEKRGRRSAVREFLEGESGEGPAIPFLDEAVAERIAQHAVGFTNKMGDAIREIRDPRKRAELWEAAIKNVGQVMYDVDKMRHYDQSGLYMDFMKFQSEAEQLLRGVEIPKTAELKTAFAKAAKMKPDDVWKMGELSDAQKRFAVKLKMLTEDFQETVKERHQELEGIGESDPYRRFLKDYYEHISGKDINSGESLAKEGTVGDTVKDLWYDSIVTGNWHIHSIHAFDAFIHGFGYLGRDFVAGARDLLLDPSVQKFVMSHQGAGLMKSARFGDEVSLKDRLDAFVEKGIKKVPGGDKALAVGRALEGSWVEGQKINLLRAGALSRAAKQMNYKGGAAQLARDIMDDNKIDQVKADEAYMRITSDLFDMIGYQAMGVKNRNVWQRGKVDLPGGKEFGPGASAFTKMLQPFMGMRTVQSRLLWKMWGDVVKSESREQFIDNLKPVVRLHTALAVNGGTAALPRAAQLAIFYALGAPALNQINKALEKVNFMPWTVGHLTPDMMPVLFGTWDNLGKIITDSHEKLHDFSQGSLQKKTGIISEAALSPSVAGLPSGRNIGQAAKNFGAAFDKKHTRTFGIYEDTVPTRKKLAGTVKDTHYDAIKAAFDTLMPTHSRHELHHEIQQGLNKSRFLDWVEAKYDKETRKAVNRKMLKGKNLEEVDWFELSDKVKERYDR